MLCAWSGVDDEKLVNVGNTEIQENDEINWKHVSNVFCGHHTAKQCRERWEAIRQKMEPSDISSSLNVVLVSFYLIQYVYYCVIESLPVDCN